MQDRVPLYPGRVTLTPVEGQANTYDMVRADQPTQAGTPLSKANLLKDSTAAQFGLAATAVPDDVLSWVGKYNEYWWSSIVPEMYGYVESKTYLNNDSTKNYYQYYYNNSPITIQYSKEITIDQTTGAVSLKNPINFTATKYNSFYEGEEKLVLQELAALAPCYLTGLYTVEYLGQNSKGTLSSDIIFLPADCTYKWNSSSKTITGMNGGYASQNSFAINAGSSVTVKASLVASSYTKIANAGDTIYLHSPNRNAYPDSGTVDGVKYTFLGKPFEKFPTMPQIETGSYIGTGTYGSNNPNSLTFTKPPQLVIIQAIDGALHYINSGYVVFVRGVTKFVGPTYTYMTGGTVLWQVSLYLSWDDNTVTWYCESSDSEAAKTQMNKSGNIYNYIAIG